MTTAPVAIERARRAALDLHARAGIHDIRALDTDTLARKLGVRVRRGGLHGAAARLVGGPDLAIVRLSSKLDREGERFSFAHEVGHWQLRHASAEVPFDCVAPRSRSDGAHDIESEASTFAAEFLMPAWMLAPLCTVPPTLDRAYAIANDFGVSVVAAAVRMVELSSTPCAAVYSRRGEVLWAVHSSSMPHRIRRGACIRPGAAAVTVAEGAFWVRPHPVPVHAWLPSGSNVDVIEESASLNASAGVISLLAVVPV